MTNLIDSDEVKKEFFLALNENRRTPLTQLFQWLFNELHEDAQVLENMVEILFKAMKSVGADFTTHVDGHRKTPLLMIMEQAEDYDHAEDKWVKDLIELGTKPSETPGVNPGEQNLLHSALLESPRGCPVHLRRAICRACNLDEPIRESVPLVLVLDLILATINGDDAYRHNVFFITLVRLGADLDNEGPDGRSATQFFTAYEEHACIRVLAQQSLEIAQERAAVARAVKPIRA